MWILYVFLVWNKYSFYFLRSGCREYGQRPRARMNQGERQHSCSQLRKVVCCCCDWCTDARPSVFSPSSSSNRHHHPPLLNTIHSTRTLSVFTTFFYSRKSTLSHLKKSERRAWPRACPTFKDTPPSLTITRAQHQNTIHLHFFLALSRHSPI